MASKNYNLGGGLLMAEEKHSKNPKASTRDKSVEGFIFHL